VDLPLSFLFCISLTSERGTKFLHTRSDSFLTLAAVPLSDYLWFYFLLFFLLKGLVSLGGSRFQTLSKHRYMQRVVMKRNK
jgi:hypothetical protein